jgi:hypothetical protein
MSEALTELKGEDLTLAVSEAAFVFSSLVILDTVLERAEGFRGDARLHQIISSSRVLMREMRCKMSFVEDALTLCEADFSGSRN